MITTTGLDYDIFVILHGKFESFFESYSPFICEDGTIIPKTNKRGRKRMIQSFDCLGLCLAWTRTRGSFFVLQMIFGMSYTSVSMYLHFGRRILIKVLMKDLDASIHVPGKEKIKEYQQIVVAQYPDLDGVWCSMDGLKLMIQCAGDMLTQNNYYSGWMHDHYMTLVVVFYPDGSIQPICCYNIPGSVHDSTIAKWGGIYTKLEQVYKEVGGKGVVDSAFQKKSNEFMIKSAQSVDYTKIETKKELIEQTRLFDAATSYR